MFGYGYYRKEEETDNERYLEGELERHRQAEERRSAEEERQRNARRQEVQEQFLWDERHASSWPEALRKQQVLFRREANQWIADEFPDEYFGPGVNACERALEIWEEEEKKRQAEADALRARLEAIGEEIRLAVADRLAAESSEHGWTGVAQAIREEDYNNWLWW